jgi:hypothetical protein
MAAAGRRSVDTEEWLCMASLPVNNWKTIFVDAAVAMAPCRQRFVR